MFGWNESGQLAQPTNLARPAECFSAVEVRTLLTLKCPAHFKRMLTLENLDKNLLNQKSVGVRKYKNYPKRNKWASFIMEFPGERKYNLIQKDFKINSSQVKR